MYIDNAQGFWGEVTSSVDWCESNYENSYYIAEFYNTISSLALICIGEFGALVNYTTSWKQVYSFHMIAIVGLGSWLFHMTLKYSTQMLDEIPMVWNSALVLLVALETRYGRLEKWVVTLLALTTVMVSGLTAFASGPFQVALFRIGFTTLELLSVIFGIINSRRVPSGSPLRPMSWLGLGMTLLAVTLWSIDIRFCQVMQRLLFNPQLHAVWHILMAMGIYRVILFSVCVHQTSTGHSDPKLKYYFGIIPYVEKGITKST